MCLNFSRSSTVKLSIFSYCTFIQGYYCHFIHKNYCSDSQMMHSDIYDLDQDLFGNLI